MKIKVLTENTSRKLQIGCEHGLSLYIETGDHKLLFDMGQSALFAENAEKLHVDLSQVEFAVLSHGHYDHGGGLKSYLHINDHAPVYLSRSAFEPHYNGADKYIGLDEELKNCDRLIFTDEEYRINENLTLFSVNKSEMRYPLDTGGLLVRENGSLIPEDFRHEQYLMIEENGKRVLFSGCSHQGILNIMNWFRPDVLVGGFHFMKHPLDDELLRYGKMLSAFDTTYYTCHCTGVEQFPFLQPLIPRMHYLSEGEEIRI